MITADVLSQSDIAGIGQVRDAWLRAINADDVDGMMAAGTDDIVALPPHEQPLVGRQANGDWHRARIGQFATRLTMKSEEMVGSSTWAIERISYSIDLTPRAGGSPLADRGACLWAWQRQPDGAWKVARAIWNSDLPLPDVEAAGRAIRQVADAYTAACNNGDLDALMATLSSDVVLLPPDAPAVSGAAAARQWLKATFFDPFDIHLAFSFTELDIRGDRAVAYGPFQLTLTPRGAGAAILTTGKFIDVYHRQGDGSWKFARVTFNADQPAPNA